MRKILSHPLFHLFLFLVTLTTTTIAGAQWTFNVSLFGTERTMEWGHFLGGFAYSLSFLGILTFHEFGHYFTARYYNIAVTLPYYIPIYFGPAMPHFGTMGAVIRIKDQMKSKKEYFDVAIAGPLAGFVVALGILIYGFTHLPPPEYIFIANPDYLQYGLEYPKYVYDQPDRSYFSIGDNLLLIFFRNVVASDPALVPNNLEIFHYPYLFAGYLACFFTALNLFPIGQLDGGHILYGLFGHKNHQRLSPAFFLLFVTYAGLGAAPIILTDNLNTVLITSGWVLAYIIFLRVVLVRAFANSMDSWLAAVAIFAIQYFAAYFFPSLEGYPAWLFFALILGRVLGIYHPRALLEEPLSPGRQLLGWLSLIVFILCFSPQPFKFV